VLLNLILGIGTILAVALLIVIFKVKGGLLGITLGSVVVLALIYWMREIKRIFNIQEEPVEKHDWLYDIIEDGENIIFVARVPGPPEKVDVKIGDGVLEVKGGEGFSKRVEIPRNVKLLEKSYVNGVLRLKLRVLGVKQRLR